jgi:hypothetical protein
MTDEARQEITADDLALVPDADDGASDAPAEDGKSDPPKDAKPQDTDADPKGKTIATGADAEAEAKAKEDKAADEHKPYWPDDWREKLAEHISAGDQKLYKKELTRLKRITDPSGVYGMYRELDNRLNTGGLVKMPGKDAKDEDVKAFQKALGWTEKPEEMLEQIALKDGAVLGDDDKPVLNEFLGAVHGAASAPDFVSKAANWYFARQEQAAAEMDDSDDEFRRESETAIKEEWGPAFKRRSNAIGSIFATAPGGVDVKNEDGLFARLMGGRMADGKRVGNDPDMLRWLDSIRGEINPAASVVEDGAGTQSVDAELEKIRGLRKTDPQKYQSDAVQKRELELIEAQLKIRARQSA